MTNTISTRVAILGSGPAGYTAAINSWARGSLGFRTDREYQSISGIGKDWDWRIGDRDA